MNLKEYFDLGLSQDLETGCPKLIIVKFWGVLFFKGGHNVLRLPPLNIYFLIEIRHNILIQCHRDCTEVEKIQQVYL